MLETLGRLGKHLHGELDKPQTHHPKNRRCPCGTYLSTYNPGPLCGPCVNGWGAWVHDYYYAREEEHLAHKEKRTEKASKSRRRRLRASVQGRRKSSEGTLAAAFERGALRRNEYAVVSAFASSLATPLSDILRTDAPRAYRRHLRFLVLLLKDFARASDSRLSELTGYTRKTMRVLPGKARRDRTYDAAYLRISTQIRARMHA